MLAAHGLSTLWVRQRRWGHIVADGASALKVMTWPELYTWL